MRTTRLAVALVAGALTLALFASSASAKTKPVFGKFKASVAGTAKGIGEAGEMTLGPYHFEECERELHSNGMVAMGEQETFFQEVKFSHCETTRQLQGGLEETIEASFTLGMEFHSNGALKLGPATTTFGATDSKCEVSIPAQWVPAVAETEKGAEKTFEGVEYGTEKEKLEGAAAKHFGEFRERLDVSWEITGINSTVKLTPECKYHGAHVNAAGEAEYTNGKMEGELEEITLGGGNLSFLPPIV
jgi:hypothetical protein